MSNLIKKLKVYYRWVLYKVKFFRRLVGFYQLYGKQNGNFYAAGLTYYSIFFLLPLLMLIFSILSFVLVSNHSLLADIYARIPDSLDSKDQIKRLISQAISSRKTVGVFGLIFAIITGMNYMASLRTALTAMWGVKLPPKNIFLDKLKNLGLFLALFLGVFLLMGLYLLSEVISNYTKNELTVRASFLTNYFIVISSNITSIILLIIIFTCILYFLPLTKPSFKRAFKVSFFAAIIYSVFLKIAVYYLKIVLNGPAGLAFGPIIALLVFLYITSRILLMMSAWLAYLEWEAKL